MQLGEGITIEEQGTAAWRKNMQFSLHIKEFPIWASSCIYGTYHIGEQWMLRRTCASVQSRQSLHYSPIQYKELEEVSAKEPHLWSFCVVAHTRLMDPKPHDAKVHFPVRRLIWRASDIVNESKIFQFSA